MALLTTQPYVITDDGVTVGERPPHYQERFVSWNQITRVACRYPRRVAYLYLYTTQGRETLVNGAVPLEPVYDFLSEHLPKGEVERCR